MRHCEKKEKGSGIKYLLPCLSGYWIPTILSPVFIVLEVLMEVFIPLLMAVIVDGGLYRQEDFMLRELFPEELIANQTKFVLTVGLIMVIAALCSLTFGILAARMAAVSGMGFARNVRSALFAKIQSFSFANTDKFSSGSLVMRLTADVNNLQSTLQQLIRGFVRAPIMMILASVMAVSIHARLAAVFIAGIPVLAVVLVICIRIGHPRFGKMLTNYDEMNRQVQEDLVAIRVVKSFVREEKEKEKFDASADELCQSQIYAQKIFSVSTPVQLLVMWGCTVLVLLLGGKEILFGSQGLHAGELVSLVSYSTQVITALGMVTFIMMSFSMTKASLNRMNEVFEEEIDIVGADTDYVVENGDLEFRHVNFSYTRDEKNLALSDIDLHIRSGETIGIIGGTGEGKSTLVQLIPRFYDCLSGEVLVGGRNVKEYSLEHLREGVSMVLQNNILFSGTILENLRWGNPDATKEQAEAACKAACAHEFIINFPKGYETELGQGGVNLSGGQKQRLRIARALLKNPKILIFDDSTSAVDTATDEHIRTALRKTAPGTTKIIISQRVTSISQADRIVVMQEGTISDVGTHEELLSRSEIYRDVYESQMKGVE